MVMVPVLSDRLAVIDRLAQQALDDADPWRGFAGFLDGLFSMQASDRSINDAVARNPVGAVDVAGECGRAGGMLAAVVDRARESGVPSRFRRRRPRDIDVGDVEGHRDGSR